MAKITKKFVKLNQIKDDLSQKGTATIIAVLIMSLMTGFVALSVARTSSESGLLLNDLQETRAFSVAEASLENMTLETDLVFESKFDIDSTDVTTIQNKLPTGFPANYEFNQTLTKIKNGQIVDATGASLQGLKALRDEWLLDSLVTDRQSGVRANVRRSFFNNRVPIFQFGVFYDDDLDFSSAPRFNFGGRVHSNGNMYASSNNGLYFDSRITVKGQIVTDILPNGSNGAGSETYIKDSNQVDRQLLNTEGSALGRTVNGGNLFATSSWRPPVYRNAGWAGIKPRFGDNLLNEQPELRLPLKGGYIDLIQRGRNVGDLVNISTTTTPSIVPVTPATTPPYTAATEDLAVAKKERYYDKVGIRISLADSKNKLPGCSNALVATVCGIRLDGNAAGNADIATTPAGNSRGYQPLQLRDSNNTINTRLNGDRLFIPGKENWIKIELVSSPLPGIDLTPVTKDITADILSLGVTERANTIANNFEMEMPYKTSTDSMSIVKLQRFYMTGEEIKVNSDYLTSKTWNTNIYNFVLSSDALPVGNAARITPDLNPSFNTTDPANTRYACHSQTPVSPATTACLNIDHVDHRKPVKIDNVGNRTVVPFPIMAFDTREGVPFDTNNAASVLNRNTLYPNGTLSVNGVMSAVDIDVANLRKFLKGDFDTILPITTAFAVAKGSQLKSTDVSEANGWVVYFSDRRGDFDFDGEYDMEDIFGTPTSELNTGFLTPGEDVNANGTLQSDYLNEAPRYSENIGADVAAVANTRFYRRAVRLINGSTVPGKYDLAHPEDTKGFTFASENGVYVLGNFNATGYDPAFAGSVVPTNKYYPQNTEEHIPTSIVADAITILSNNWKDAKIFRYPFIYNDARDRAAIETTVRFAVITGDGLSFAPCVNDATNGNSGFPCVTGGVHNLNRFLEIWDGNRLHYTGSLINLYNSRNNNGSFKCCNSVYRPPIRDFSFDKSFLNPNRLPPGTPFIQTIQVTGFQKMNQ
jgi:hypothetical protein